MDPRVVGVLLGLGTLAVLGLVLALRWHRPRRLSMQTVRSIARAHQRERGDGMLADVRVELQHVSPDVVRRTRQRMGLEPEAGG